ncbi:hypothetical protein [Gordonia sihwensis]|uniref:hypothetical protein n=1 Tax=Gordonia sihwensis TaxID=173559 RepID=UPI003D98A6AC
MALTTVRIAFPGDVFQTVTAETTTNPNIVIAPAVRMSAADGSIALDHDARPNLVHVPTGRTIFSTRSLGIPLAKAVEILSRHGDWSQPAPLTPEAQKACWQQLYAAADRDGWPWPDWAGDQAQPALSVIGGHLEEAIKQIDTFSPEVRQRHANYIDSVTDIDDAKEKIKTLLVMQTSREYTTTYGLVYTLAVLHRINTTAADSVARELVAQWEYGDTLGERMWQWRNELENGTPLTLRGYPEAVAEELTSAP